VPSSKAATLLGVGAILLWATLASLTALTGAIPPFETTAIVFLIGSVVILLAAAARGRLARVIPTPASLALGVAGSFGYPAPNLPPPAQASLIASLWALFTVLFSALLPGHRLRASHVVGAMLGLTAAAALVWDKLGTGEPGPTGTLGFALALACAFVWSSYSV